MRELISGPVVFSPKSHGRISLPLNVFERLRMIPGDAFNVYLDEDEEELIYKKISAGEDGLPESSNVVCEELSKRLDRASIVIVDYKTVRCMSGVDESSAFGQEISAELAAIISDSITWTENDYKTCVYTSTIEKLTLVDLLNVKRTNEKFQRHMEVLAVVPVKIKKRPVGAILFLRKDGKVLTKATLKTMQMMASLLSKL